MTKELFEMKVNAKIAAFTKDPESMLVENMSGKMADCKAITTSCANNETCQARIKAAFDMVRKHSAAAACLVNDYCLPSKDKNHITQKELITGLEKIGCKVPVCMFCYAQKSLTGYRGDAMNIKYTAVLRYLSTDVLSMDQLPIIAGFKGDDGRRYERIESHGDTKNAIHAENYILTCLKNPAVNFTAWTKNPEHYYQAMLKHGKPKNLKLILSSYFLNTPDIKLALHYNELLPGMIDSVFTVWTENGMKLYNVTLNCCGQTDAAGNVLSRRCNECMNCYYKAGSENKLLFAAHPEIQAVNEILR